MADMTRHLLGVASGRLASFRPKCEQSARSRRADQTQRSLARRSLPMSALYLLAPKRRNSRFIALIWVRYVVSS
jgi:hypothetical protein